MEQENYIKEKRAKIKFIFNEDMLNPIDHDGFEERFAKIVENFIDKENKKSKTLLQINLRMGIKFNKRLYNAIIMNNIP